MRSTLGTHSGASVRALVTISSQIGTSVGYITYDSPLMSLAGTYPQLTLRPTPYAVRRTPYALRPTPYAPTTPWPGYVMFKLSEVILQVILMVCFKVY